MATFADELCAKIKGHAGFWSDLESVCALAMQTLIPGIQSELRDVSDLDGSFQRLIRSATAFAQTGNDQDRALAQNISLYIAVSSSDIARKALACDLLADIGNHPGAEWLRKQLDIPDGSFSSFVRTSLLRSMNTIVIEGGSRVLTDFQHSVWSALPLSSARGISAPTSAGKSFVVIEYLCQQAILASTFQAVFIAPTRALLTEVHGKLSRRLDAYSNTIRISTIPTLDSENKPKQIFVLTQERLQVLLATWSGTLNLVIVDEAQAIGDDTRGMILQDCLEVISNRSEDTRFLFLAPGASNFEAFIEAANVVAIDVDQTDLSPVVQNRIVVEPALGDKRRIDLTLLAEDHPVNIGYLRAKRGFGNANTLLAATALELGRNGGSLVYGTGPADAEKVAGQIASDITEKPSDRLEELAQFVRDHVHPRYSLADQVLKGVGFHYGKMPSLLREAIEDAFQNSDLRYLVCTTTLFQGVNLPARNVFIDTPKRGRGEDLDPAALWNFAGRAGRLGKDIIGNVFLVGYGKWESQPLNERQRYAITPSFRRVVTAHRAQVLARLKGDAVEDSDKSASVAETAAGLLISRAARQTLKAFVKRTLADTMPEGEQKELVEAAEQAFTHLELPTEALTINWTVNAYGQARLLKRFREKISEGKSDDLIPIHPASRDIDPYKRYLSIFSRLNREIYGKSASPKFNNRLTVDALAWMRGQPLPVIINKRIKYLEKQERKSKIDSTIRGVFDFIEDTLRFRYVQLGRCYTDLLRFALREATMEDAARGVYDFALALELGISSVAGQAFIELGLSRITSAALEGLIPDSDPSVERAREWLSGLTEVGSTLSKIIWLELVRKKLVPEDVGGEAAA